MIDLANSLQQAEVCQDKKDCCSGSCKKERRRSDIRRRRLANMFHRGGESGVIVHQKKANDHVCG